MAKSKHSKKEEFYAGEARRLESENKSLRRKLKQLEKQAHFYDKSEDEPKESKVTLKQKCSECEQGNIVEMIVLDRLIYKCDNCKWRSKAVKLV